MYNLCDYLTYQYVFFIFFLNNVGSYDLWFDPTIYDPIYLPRSYERFRFLITLVSPLFLLFFWSVFFCGFMSHQWVSCTVHETHKPLFFINFFIKNRSHDTIYIFKNYFVTVFSIFNFQRYSNGPLVKSLRPFL